MIYVLYCAYVHVRVQCHSTILGHSVQITVHSIVLV